MSRKAKSASTPPVAPLVPSRSKPRIPNRTKQAVIALYAQNGSIIHTAQHFGIHRHTVRRILLAVRSDPRSGLNSDWKTSIKVKAVQAVESGLDSDDDPYKRGELGNKVLVGLGEFKSGQDVNVGIQVNQCPPELLARLIETPNDDEHHKM